MFELRLYKNMHYVQILYRDSEKLPEPMNIPDCGQSCPLRKMYILYANSLPASELDVECAQLITSLNNENIFIPMNDQKSSAVGKVPKTVRFKIEPQL